MEEYLREITSGSLNPILTAIVLGLFINFDPCVCGNISAIGFLSKDIGNKNKIIRNSLLYMSGKTLAYLLLGIVVEIALYYAADVLAIRDIMAEWGERVLGPILIVAGLFILGVGHHGGKHCEEHHHHSSSKLLGGMGAFGLGVACALAFCPYSATVYFGLIDLCVGKGLWNGIGLIVLFSIMSVVPIFLLSWLLAYGVTNMATMRNKIDAVNVWARKVTAGIFFLSGVWLCIEQVIEIIHG